MKREYEEIINEMFWLPVDGETRFEGITDRAIVGLMLCKRLDKLAACAGDTKGYGRRLCIAGDVTTCEL